MVRPKRGAARHCTAKVDHEEESQEPSDVSDWNRSEEEESAGASSWKTTRGKGKRRKSLEKSILQGVPTPETPLKTSAPVGRRRTRASRVAAEVVNGISDLSDPDFDSDFVETDDNSDSESDAPSRKYTKKENGNGRGRRRQKHQSRKLQQAPKLEWELLDDEWENVWGDATEDDFDAMKLSKSPLEQKESPAELLMPLLPFQKEWLAWSLKQEASVMKGGILADEMGMGKTIQAISLVVAGRAVRENLFPPKLDLNPAFVPSTSQKFNLDLSITSSSSTFGRDILKPLPQVKGTLVVCPVVAVLQWKNEVARFTASGSVKVLVYHGPHRSIGVAELGEYDIILTTYSIVELEHRKHVMPPKEPCQWCGKPFSKDRLAVHQRYFCGPHARRTLKQAKQEKRRITPFISGEVHVDVDLEIVKGQGKRQGTAKGKSQKLGSQPVEGGRRTGRKRKIDAEDLEDALLDAVKSNETGTEESKELDMEKASSSNPVKGPSALHSVRWGRIILDEAHSIKDRKTSTAKAVFALQSEYKWALSGTPLQNRVGELYSLVRFLGIHPFSYYFCRKCECKSLDYQFMNGQKCECGHSPMLHFCWWNKFIANPIKRWGYVQGGRRAMQLLKYKVLNNTLLRRTKLQCAADLALPPRTAFLRRDAFDAREDDFYQALYTQSQSQFNTYVTAGTLVNNYAHIFDLLTRLRQAVDHPYLVVYSATANSKAPSVDPVQDGVCGICHEPAEDAVSTGCNHIFCKSCIQEYIAASQELASQCPRCSKPLTVDLTGAKTAANAKNLTARERGYKRTSILNRIDLNQFQSSTKIDAVREEINLMLQKDPAAKAIIFSQFTSMLDLIGFSLQKSDIKCVKLDGSMTMGARDQMIEAFTNDSNIKVFLMSLKAGGVALNLTVASNVFLMDPWWNPAVEQQAQDRIHRLGQYKPIRVTRFVIENTIEERILKLQEKKQLVFEGTVGGSAEALGRLTEDDLRFLFSH